MVIQQTVGFLGFGNMGRAIAQGLIESKTVGADRVLSFDVEQTKRDEAAALGIRAVADPLELAQSSGVLVLAVKPQSMADALEGIRPGLGSDILIVSIAAGITIRFIQKTLGPNFRIVRIMPNTPALVGAGAAGMAVGANCTSADAALVRAIFESVGMVEQVNEPMLDVVTALSGSGPAYFFYMVESLVKAATHLGLCEDQAQRLAIQTMFGAGKLLLESGEPASVLRERVTSKRGTTEAALRSFAVDRFENVVGEAVRAAAMRSRELAQ